MAVELLLKNISDVHPDPKIDRIASLKRGDLVFAKELPHDEWNEYETLPEFSRLIVSNANISGITSYMESWCVEMSYEVLNYNSTDDVYLIKMFSNTPGLGTLGVIDPTQLYHHLENWGLTISGISSNEIIFEADMKQVMKSVSFWGGSANDIVFNWVSFDSGTKTHTLKISYSGYHPYDPSRLQARNYVENILVTNGGTIIQESIYGQLIEATIPSQSAINKFKEDLAQKSRKTVFARRYYLNNTAMNAIGIYMQNNNGDAMTTDKATLFTYVNDRLDEN